MSGLDLSRRWARYYNLDPTKLNRVVPPAYVVLAVGLVLCVSKPWLLSLICLGIVSVNMSLSVWVTAFVTGLRDFQRFELGRLCFNTLAEVIVISMFVHEAPVWCLSLTGALLFSSVWTGKMVIFVHALHLTAIVLALLLAGQDFSQVLVASGVYLLCCSVTVYLLYAVSIVVTDLAKASAEALTLKADQYARDVADHRSEVLASTNQLASSLAHEVNNPLFAVTGNLDFTYDELQASMKSGNPLSEEAVEALEEAMAAASTIAGITRQMQSLNLSNMKDFERVADLDALVAEAVKQIVPRLPESCAVELDLQPTPVVSLNRHGIKQVLFNLILNAGEACQGIGRPAKLSVSTSTDFQGRACLRIRDNGKGISKQDMVKVFTPFFTTRPTRGSGLGLMVVHTIVESLGGRVDVDSEVDQGTSFTILIPPANDVEQGDGLVPSEEVVSSGTLHPCRILIVDDDDRVLKMLKRLLSAHEVVACASSAEGDAALSRGRFDLVLCDIVMPGETGVEWFARVAQGDRQIAESWVFLTGGALNDDALKEARDTGRPLLLKPIEVSKLRETLGDVVRKPS